MQKLLVVFLSLALFAPLALAQDEVNMDTDSPVDITKDIIMGPGSVSIETKYDIMMSFGARTRIIPTSETNWDFGFEDNLEAPLLGGALDPAFFKQHANESGWVNHNYIRNETQIYFNALPNDRKWSFYAALEFDRPMDVRVVDDRGGLDDKTSDFGLERLHGSYQLPGNLRLHAGFDIWEIDATKGGFVYGDDAPGFWLKGEYENFDFNLGYFKLSENNFQVEPNLVADGKDDDRDLYAGYVDLNPAEGMTIRTFYAYDRIRSSPTGSFLQALTNNMGPVAKTDSHYLGAYYTGEHGAAEVFVEGVYKFGEAEDTGLAQDDFDISAFALAGDLAVNINKMFKPHIGVIYTSGDDDPADDELSGYTGVANTQRYSAYYGGETSIPADTNFMLGTAIYGYVPELYGNGTPVPTGGLENFAGFGNGRGDNPGMTMTSLGVTITPKRYLSYRANVNSFWWNEDINVPSFVNPQVVTTVDGGYTGTEWDNELTLALSRHSFIKAQASLFFPGSTIEDVTSARSSVMIPGDGPESDDTAYRLAMEFIWMF
jgi:hypothetical protein